MANGNGKTQVVLDEGTDAVIVRGSIKVQFNANGGIDVYGNVPVTLHAPVNDTAQSQTKAKPQAKAEPQVGDRMEDGTIFAGVSPDTNAPMYATPADAPLTMAWKDAMRHAAGFEGHVRAQGAFRVPTRGELNVLFQNRARIGGFNETGDAPAGWYWSSTENGDNIAYKQRFKGRQQGWGAKSDHSSVRLVRSESFSHFCGSF